MPLNDLPETRPRADPRINLARPSVCAQYGIELAGHTLPSGREEYFQKEYLRPKGTHRMSEKEERELLRSHADHISKFLAYSSQLGLVLEACTKLFAELKGGSISERDVFNFPPDCTRQSPRRRFVEEQLAVLDRLSSRPADGEASSSRDIEPQRPGQGAPDLLVQLHIRQGAILGHLYRLVQSSSASSRNSDTVQCALSEYENAYKLKMRLFDANFGRLARFAATSCLRARYGLSGAISSAYLAFEEAVELFDPSAQRSFRDDLKWKLRMEAGRANSEESLSGFSFGTLVGIARPVDLSRRFEKRWHELSRTPKMEDLVRKPKQAPMLHLFLNEPRSLEDLLDPAAVEPAKDRHLEGPKVESSQMDAQSPRTEVEDNAAFFEADEQVEREPEDQFGDTFVGSNRFPGMHRVCGVDVTEMSQIIEGAGLLPDDLRVITKRYGLDGRGPRLLGEVAREMQVEDRRPTPVTNERISQRELRALKQLREYIETVYDHH